MKRYRVALDKAARQDLDAIRDRRTRKAIVERALKLEQEPERQGKPLKGELQGYYSLRAAVQRYRLIYELQSVKGLVVIVVIAIRKEGDKGDAYSVARRRLGR
ncbi:MAG: type II toxin-antitoxin system RelE/ParE family toxin [Trueperaceae bacterium]